MNRQITAISTHQIPLQNINATSQIGEGAEIEKFR